MLVLEVPSLSSSYGSPNTAGLKLCSSLYNSAFTRYSFPPHNELQHPEHTSIIGDTCSYDDGEQMAAHEEQALPGNSC